MEPQVGMVMVRAIRDNVTTYLATLMKGQEGECPIDRARELVGKGEVEPVDGELHVPGVGMVGPRDRVADRTETTRNPAPGRAEKTIRKGQ